MNIIQVVNTIGDIKMLDMLHKFLSSKTNITLLCIVVYTMIAFILMENNFSFGMTAVILGLSVIANFLYFIYGVSQGIVMSAVDRADVLYEMIKKVKDDIPKS